MTRMFFRREKPHHFTFEERIGNLRSSVRVTPRDHRPRALIRDGCVAIAKAWATAKCRSARAACWPG